MVARLTGLLIRLYYLMRLVRLVEAALMGTWVDE